LRSRACDGIFFSRIDNPVCRMTSREGRGFAL
jgi:hypothetical protein